MNQKGTLRTPLVFVLQRDGTRRIAAPVARLGQARTGPAGTGAFHGRVLQSGFADEEAK
ncbi:hypothetical protein ABZ848_44925 [Streptomyces sp. NPDC047081]|uniref:hypothetical protein n=1 Tax=Streptomyces sp. NPDC047081 TaxID=3154706 RepID=UPI0033E8EA31